MRSQSSSYALLTGGYSTLGQAKAWKSAEKRDRVREAQNIKKQDHRERKRLTDEILAAFYATENCNLSKEVMVKKLGISVGTWYAITCNRNLVSATLLQKVLDIILGWPRRKVVNNNIGSIT